MICLGKKGKEKTERLGGLYQKQKKMATYTTFGWLKVVDAKPSNLFP
jgi:hypothetical protein